MAAHGWNYPLPYYSSYTPNPYFHPFGNPNPDFARDNRKQLTVKVEHEGSCRRFSCAYVDGYGRDLDIIKLRRMIFKLFDLNEGSRFTMTYSDFDNEWITFSSDEELRDAVLHQCLNPLRVRIAMNVSAPDPPIEDYISKKAEAIRIGEIRPPATELSESHYHVPGVSRLRTAQQLPPADYSGTDNAQEQMGWETEMAFLELVEQVLNINGYDTAKDMLKSIGYDLQVFDFTSTSVD